jgi:hypothetical protein
VRKLIAHGTAVTPLVRVCDFLINWVSRLLLPHHTRQEGATRLSSHPTWNETGS